MIKVVEKSSNEVFAANRIEGGYEVFYITEEGKIGDRYKKLKDSTFKKYFRVTGESWSEPQVVGASPEEVEEEKYFEEEPAPKKEKTAKKEPEKKKVEKKEEPTEELTGDKKKKMIEKIQKMLNLSKNNPSQEEAMSAALQAQKLMVKYNIHEDDVTLEEIKEEIDSFTTDQKRTHSWRKQLALIVAKNFRCKSYLLNHKDVTFRGYKEDAKLALEVYLMLYEVGDKLGSACYNEQLRTIGTGKGAYNSFVVGFLQGIEDGFHGQCAELMVITPQEVEDEFVEFCKASNAKNKKTSALSVTSRKAYDKGYEEGKKVVKGRALGKSKE